MGADELATDILTGFVDEASGHLVALSLAVEDGDSQAVQHLAHTMKGAAEIVGALALSEVSGRLEAAGRAGDLSAAGPLLREVDDRFCEVSDIVHATSTSAAVSCSADGVAP